MKTLIIAVALVGAISAAHRSALLLSQVARYVGGVVPPG